ncbi:hypothetical protein IQ244_29735 [Nostoc sp. LEGE 06077]|uniref:hypothetical protein n=1 Tax=Nostoc sp. LEGE 06077 TaxID=915325 RepID=UPI00187EDB92|nr:hypothetical protein [Nostoc sp. LEGE 06077]MBE9210611.1 hypothetical protein [Nostoc sp. LEGE 06077]
MSNLSVFQTLRQDNPDLFTAAGLSALLGDCLCVKYPEHHKFTYPSLLNLDVYLALAEIDNSIQHQKIIHLIMANPNAWPAIVKSGRKSDPNSGKLFYADYGAWLFLYYRIRDKVYQLQKNLNISGVSQRHISIRDRLFSFPKEEALVLMLHSDACGNIKDERTILQNAVPEITNYFLKLVEISPAYNLFLVGENNKKIPTTAVEVEKAASKAVKAEIDSQSYNWKKISPKRGESEPIDLLDPDEIHLCLHLDWDNNEVLFFEAHHPDKSRCPWAN